jgi:transposase
MPNLLRRKKYIGNWFRQVKKLIIKIKIRYELSGKNTASIRLKKLKIIEDDDYVQLLGSLLIQKHLALKKENLVAIYGDYRF